MFEVPVLLVLIVVVALIFDFTNGAHDCANAIATVVSTKVLSPRTAVIMAATLNLIGAFLGTKVANTLGSGIVHPDIVANCQPLVLAALIGAIGWNLFTWHFGIPSSSSHALIGGLMGAAVAYAGFSSLNGGSILTKILLPLVLSHPGHHPAHDVPVRRGEGAAGHVPHHVPVRKVRAEQAQYGLHAASGALGGVHGDQPRYERCPENDGGDHPCPLHFQRNRNDSRPPLGQVPLCRLYGARYCHGRLENRQNHGA